MRIAIAGGSGFLGTLLADRLRAGGHQISILTRRHRGIGDVVWDPAVPSGAWVYCVERSDAVINLAGETIGRRWTAARKAAIRESRIGPTRALARVIAKAEQGPRVFLNSSAIGFYGERGDEALTEDSPPGSGFLANIATEWEAEARQAERAARVVLLRTAPVLGSSGGVLPQMALPFRFGVGGRAGSGRQYMSWIHQEDWAAMVEWALHTIGLSGPVNVTSPDPVTNQQFSETLARALHRPALMPAPAFMLRLMLGEMAELLLQSQRVVPARAQRMGFTFRYPQLENALRAIYGRLPPG